MSTLLKVENLTQQFVLDKSFLDQIKLCSRNIEISTFRIGYLHIILGDFIHLDLLNPLINAQTMVLMYDIISYLQFREALDLSSFVYFALSFFLYFSENICL